MDYGQTIKANNRYAIAKIALSESTKQNHNRNASLCLATGKKFYQTRKYCINILLFGTLLCCLKFCCVKFTFPALPAFQPPIFIEALLPRPFNIALILCNLISH